MKKRVSIIILLLIISLSLLGCNSNGEYENIATKEIVFNYVTMQIPESYKLNESRSTDNEQYYDLENEKGELEKRIRLFSTEEDTSLDNTLFDVYLDQAIAEIKAAPEWHDFSDVAEENFSGTPAKSFSFKRDLRQTTYYGKGYVLYLNHRTIYIEYLSLEYNMHDFLEIIKSISTDNLEIDAIIESESADSIEGATLGEKNALSKALDYLDSAAFSYAGLIEQLEYEGFTNAEATYGADHCGADWNEQAALKAKDYIDSMSFSRQGLVEQLEYEGFTHEQAEYGVSSIGY